MIEVIRRGVVGWPEGQFEGASGPIEPVFVEVPSVFGPRRVLHKGLAVLIAGQRPYEIVSQIFAVSDGGAPKSALEQWAKGTAYKAAQARKEAAKASPPKPRVDFCPDFPRSRTLACEGHETRPARGPMRRLFRSLLRLARSGARLALLRLRLALSTKDERDFSALARAVEVEIARQQERKHGPAWPAYPPARYVSTHKAAWDKGMSGPGGVA